MPGFQIIPSIEQVLQRPELRAAVERHGRQAVTAAAREAAEALRGAIELGHAAPTTTGEASAWMGRHVQRALIAQVSPSLRRVINATGVILHTNLGRAPLAREAIDRILDTAAGYSNLEYDLEAGARGHRHVHAERMLTHLTGAPAAAVVNNNAAATLLVLAALASGREVIVSRGELVEIGGGFRVPEVMAQSGAVLREVGTTNRTRLADYAAAISERTALILRVHPSNFRIDGFTERPDTTQLAALAHEHEVPVFEDLGSGWLFEERPAALADEPSVRASLASGVDVVAFSGDKLLGGPQAGLIVGSADAVALVRRHPLMRALRVDKLTCAALEATLSLWLQEPARSRIPVHRMLTATLEQLEPRVRSMTDRLSGIPGVTAEVLDGSSTVGGGSAPGSALPTRLLALRVDGLSSPALEHRLRTASVPVIARIEHDKVLLDLRTVSEEEDEEILGVVRNAADSRPEA